MLASSDAAGATGAASRPASLSFVRPFRRGPVWRHRLSAALWPPASPPSRRTQWTSSRRAQCTQPASLSLVRRMMRAFRTLPFVHSVGRDLPARRASRRSTRRDASGSTADSPDSRQASCLARCTPRPPASARLLLLQKRERDTCRDPYVSRSVLRTGLRARGIVRPNKNKCLLHEIRIESRLESAAPLSSAPLTLRGPSSADEPHLLAQSACARSDRRPRLEPPHSPIVRRALEYSSKRHLTTSRELRGTRR